MMIEVPGIVSNNIWDDDGVSLNSILFLLLSKGTRISSSWNQSRWGFILNMINMVSSGGVGLSTPLDLIGVIVLLISPGVVSLAVWSNVGLAVFSWIGSLNLLDKSWGKSSSFILDMIDMVSSSDVSLLTPGNLVRLVVLGIIPRVVSLVIWVDVRVAIFDWINGVVLLNQSSKWVSIWSNGL